MLRDRLAALPTFAGLLAAAGASIATSAPPEWHLDSSVDGPTVFLSTSHPSATFHATAQASEPSVISVTASQSGSQGNATGDAGTGDAGATDARPYAVVGSALVDVTLARDGDPAADTEHTTIRGSEPTYLGVGSYSGACHGNCPAGVTITFTLDTTSASTVAIDWTVRAVIQGEGDSPPAGESVDVQLR